MKTNFYALTKREIEILQMISEGFRNGDISEKFFISKRTVEVHRYNIVKKLGLKSSSDLMRFALLNKDKIRGGVGISSKK